MSGLLFASIRVHSRFPSFIWVNLRSSAVEMFVLVHSRLPRFCLRDVDDLLCKLLGQLTNTREDSLYLERPESESAWHP